MRETHVLSVPKYIIKLSDKKISGVFLWKKKDKDIMNYKYLHQKSDELCSTIIKSLGGEYKCLAPPKFNLNIQFLIMGVNPSSAHGKINRTSDSEGLLTLSDAPACRKELTDESKNELIYENYYKKPYQLVKALDPKVRIFWRHEKHFEEIEKKFPFYNTIFQCIRKEGIIDGGDNDSYLLFNDLIYVMEKSQRKIQRILNKKVHSEICKKTVELFKLQLQYYKPKIVLISNSFASRFILEEVYNTSIDSINAPTSIVDEDVGSRIFFSSTITGSRALDVFCFSRLKEEIASFLT